MMDCPTCRNLLPELRDPGLTTVDAEAVRRHLASCAACRAHLEAEEAVDALLRAAPMRQPPTGFTATVLARVSAAPQPERSLVAWLATLASMLSVTALVIGMRRLGEQLTWAPGPDEQLTWAPGPESWLSVAGRWLSLRPDNGPSWVSLPRNLPLPAPDVLQLGTVATAAVILLALTTLYATWTALERA